MRRTLALAAMAMAALPAGAQTNPFAGAWNITPEAPGSGVYWLEVKDDGGKPAVMFLNRGGSPVAAQDVKLSRRRSRASRPSAQGSAPGTRFRTRHVSSG